MKTKKIKLSKIIKTLLLTVLFYNSLSYCTNNEMNKQNNLLGKKREGNHNEEDIEALRENNKKINRFYHSVSFHPGKLGLEEEIYNKKIEFDMKYGSKIIEDENIDEYIYTDCAVFKYDEFVNANNQLKEIIKNENKNIQNSKITEYHTILNNLNNKEFPILELSQDDFEVIKRNYCEIQVLNIQHCNTEIENFSKIKNIENILKQIILLKNSINIIKDRLYYKTLIDNIKIKEYGIYEKNINDINEDNELFVSNKKREEIRKNKIKYETNKKIYEKKLLVVNKAEEDIKYKKEFSENLFNQLNEIELINRNPTDNTINNNFEFLKDYYNKLKSSDIELPEKFNIIEQFYSIVTDSKQLFSIFNIMLERNNEIFTIFNDLLCECVNIQSKYENVTYGGIDLINQTIANTITKHFIKNFSSEIKYRHSKQYNKEIFNNSYNDFINRIFYSVSKDNTTRNMKNYLDHIVINKLNEVISDVERYREIFSKSDYSNGYKFFNDLHKFLKNNMNNVTNYPFEKFKYIWENAEKTFKQYISNDLLFKKIWLSTPKFPQLEQIWNLIYEYNSTLENNNISNDEIAEHKNDRDIIIRNFWRNFIFDRDILDSLLQKNDRQSLELINEMLDIKEIIDYNAQEIYSYYINRVKEDLNNKKINEKQVNDCYFDYLKVYYECFSNNIKYLESKIDNKNIDSKKNEMLKIRLDLLKSNLKKFEENGIKYKSDDFIQTNIPIIKKKLKFITTKYK